MVNSYKQYTDDSINDKVNATYDVKTWHETLRHCNVSDVLKLPDVEEGMKITGSSMIEWNVYTEGKFTNNRNKNADVKAQMELVHTDVARPIEPAALEGHKLTVKCQFTSWKTTQWGNFCSWEVPSGQCTIRGYKGYQVRIHEHSLLRDKGIRPETSSPCSLHQNGTAERQWEPFLKWTVEWIFEGCCSCSPAYLVYFIKKNSVEQTNRWVWPRNYEMTTEIPETESIRMYHRVKLIWNNESVNTGDVERLHNEDNIENADHNGQYRCKTWTKSEPSRPTKRNLQNTWKTIYQISVIMMWLKRL